MRRLIWAPSAQRDLRSIILWYEQFDLDLPGRLIDDIEAAAAKLLDHPLLGSALPDSTHRKWRALGTLFILFYRPVRNGVRVLQVIHEATDWKRRA